MHIKSILLAFVSIFASFSISEARDVTFKSFGDSFVNDFKYVGNNIANMSTNDLLIGGGICSGTALLLFADEPARDFMKDNQGSDADTYFDLANNFGEPITAGIITGGLILTGFIADDADIADAGRITFESLLIAGALNGGMKFTFGRHRPYLNDGNTKFDPFSAQDKFNSFPSGHTTVAFAMATALSCKIDRWWAYTGLYTIAASTGLARMYKDKHWISDVFMGAAIGTVSALAVVKAHEHDKNKKKPQLEIAPNFTPGITFSWNF